jgi:hypothetical protein
MDPLSRFQTHGAHIRTLYEEGRIQAEAWLRENFACIGSRSTLAFGPHLFSAAS